MHWKKRIGQDSATRSFPHWRRGNVIVLAALLMTLLVGLVAFAIDCGIIVLARTQLQSAADAGAMAGAAALSDGPTDAQTAAQSAAQANVVGGASVSVVPALDIQLGTWDKDALTFTTLIGDAQAAANAVRVTCQVNHTRGNSLKLFFAPIFGFSSSDVSALATATRASVNCGPFVGLNYVTISGGSYTDSYNSDNGAYTYGAAGDKGHVCSNGKITLSGGATVVNGDAHPGTASTVSMSGGSSVVGSTKPLESPLTEPAVNPGDAATANNNANIPKSAQNKAPLDADGDFKLSGGDMVTVPPGTYYFSTLTLSGGASISITGKTIIYVTGNVDVSGGSILNSTQLPVNCQLYGMGSKVVLSGSSQWYGVVYAPTADITRSGGSSDFFGMAVGKSLTLSGGGGCHYDESLGGLTGAQSGAQLVQ